MATKDKKTTAKESKAPKKPSKLKAFFRSERSRFIAGLLILVFSASLAVAFLSFLVTGKDDQALLENMPLSAIFSTGNGLSNWGGTVGAFAAEYCINRWIGLSAFLFVVFLFRFGYSMIQRLSLRPLVGVFVRTALWAIWFSLFFGMVCAVLDAWFDLGMQSQFIYLGGKHGYDFAQLLIANLGTMGLIFVIIATGLILSAFVFASTMDRTRRLFDIAPWFKVRYSDLRKKVLERQAKRQAEKEKQEEEARQAALLAQQQGEQDVIEPQNPGDVQTIVDTPVQITPEVTPAVEVTPVVKEVIPEVVPVTPVTPVVPVSPVTPVAPIIPDTPIVPDTNDPTFTIKTNTTEVVDEPVAKDTDDLPMEDYDPTADLSHYQFPGFELLKAYDSNVSVDMNEQNENKEKIRQTLSDYGIEIQSISATVGPTITLFEIVLVSGTKISRVKNLSDEIAMSIASKSGIRIIAPIPGKSAIGIEVPNNDPQTVSMRECISSRAFQEAKMELPVALGKTITNEVFTFDLAKAPHLLVAGATGQGKSVGLNAIITSLLYKKHPNELKIVLVDPKKVEFTPYSPIADHFMAATDENVDEPIITDVTKVVRTLNSLCVLMDHRYDLLKAAGAKNIKEYNAKFVNHKLNLTLGHEYMPYVVVIIDEFGDLIMTAGKEVELPIARIAQLARAVGIHMIIATQRPTTSIITGNIKANFPGRMAFRVGAMIDSRTILDRPGANQLVGRGDLLFLNGGEPVRVQCAFVDTPEIERINEFISNQPGPREPLELPEPPSENGGGGNNGGPISDLDPYFEEAAHAIVISQQGSTSMIQRRFSIGYNRAGRLMDQLEQAGIVGPAMGSKPRDVLITDENSLNTLLLQIKGVQ